MGRRKRVKSSPSSSQTTNTNSQAVAKKFKTFFSTEPAKTARGTGSAIPKPDFVQSIALDHHTAMTSKFSKEDLYEVAQAFEERLKTTLIAEVKAELPASC